MWLVVVLCINVFCSNFGDAYSEQPNIIVIIADDLGWNDVSFHGANQIPTPNIDALAYNGLILNRHYVQPTCTPSRSAFLTGLYPIRSGMQGRPLSASTARGIPIQIKLLPQYLNDLGYVTRLVGKWHVGYFTKNHTPTYRGFDSFFGYYNGMIEYYGHTYRQRNIVGYDVHRDYNSSLHTEKVNGYFTDLITEESKKIIENHDHTQPLFLQVNHLAPHSSQAEDSLEVRDRVETDTRFSYIENTNRRKYASMVSSLDDSVGKIVTSLKDAGLLENSIILFMTDNGAQTEGLLQNFGSNYPLRGLKFTLFEGAIRGVACLYSPLLKKPGRVVDETVHITDWLPTLYAAAGGDPKSLQDLDGQNQWPLLRNSVSSGRVFTLLDIDEVSNLEGIMIGRYKLINGAKSTYGGYYGDTGRDPRNPEYDILGVINSETNMAIKQVFSGSLTVEQIENTRQKSQVQCENVSTFPNCTEVCLFDIIQDPCENIDVSKHFPEVVNILETSIKQHRKKLVKQNRVRLDPNGFPNRFNGYYWMPWIDCSTDRTNTNVCDIA